MSRTPENVVQFYNKRGMCEQHIKEGMKLIETGARIVSHPRMIVLQMAEVAVPEKLF